MTAGPTGAHPHARETRGPSTGPTLAEEPTAAFGAYEGARRTSRHAGILAAATQRLALNATARDIYAGLGGIARTLLDADGSAVYLADSDADSAHLVFTEGAGESAAAIVVTAFWQAGGGQAVRRGEAEFRSDLSAFEHEPASRELLRHEIRSVALLPLQIEGRPRGLLTLRFRTPQPFEEAQRQLLTDFAAHVAVALRNAQQLDALERRAVRFAAVADLQQAVSAAGSLDDVAAELYRAITTVVDAPCFTLFTVDETERILVPAYVVNDGAAVDCSHLPRFPLSDGATSQAFRSGVPNIAARSHRGWTGRTHELTGAGRIAVVLSAPIVHGERVLGVLQAQSYRADAYDWDDLDIVMLIARQAGTALAKARLLDAERRARQEAEAASAIAHAALGAPGMDVAARAILRILDVAAPGAASLLGVVDERRRAVLVFTARDDARPGPDAVVPCDVPATAESAGACVLGRLDQAPGGAVPLLSRGRLIGGIGLGADDRSGADDRRALLSRLAGPVALALDALFLREAEQHKAMRERMLAAALETMDQPVFICSRSSIIQYANGAALDEYGYSREELSGLHARRLSAHHTGGMERQEIHRAMEEGGAWAGELIQQRRDGTDFPAAVAMRVIRDDEGAPAGVVVALRNLTEERRVAEQLRQSEKLVALGELVAGVAHEVNNPLTGISAFAQLLMATPLPPDQAEAVQLIRREAERAAVVVRDLLTFARKTGPRIVSVDLNALMEQTLRLRGYALKAARVAVRRRLDPELPAIQGDDRQLQQVLLNLVVNSEHAMGRVPPTHRILTVCTAAERDRIVVEVTDTGTGMAPDILKRIFEPFFTTKGDGEGTGLGLSVSYGIVQTHGGTIAAHSAPGAGATFRITLPAARVGARVGA